MKRIIAILTVFASLNLLAEAQKKELRTGNSYIQCEASKYDDNRWSSLGQFRSPEIPVNNNGEMSLNAQLESGSIVFSAAGNFDQGLIYFGSIYDYERKAGTQVQLAMRPEISLYLLLDQIQYSLNCEIQPEK